MDRDVLVDTSSRTKAAKMRNEPQPARTPGMLFIYPSELEACE
jgi:hypothetical protein